MADGSFHTIKIIRDNSKSRNLEILLDSVSFDNLTVDNINLAGSKILIGQYLESCISENYFESSYSFDGAIDDVESYMGIVR